ncbi:hypothetical protein [Paenibacillus protaetiae]|uniref:Uncharacterized protein n=1 Tax=Paenibacillus protaetiae TaxID=2509456 RepID=A0A4P6ESJ0_9BACL|nr:hypothetical protein [Paenibacillus protaetiae]QAY66090.1 hypothetical protein ET464_06485 [Paenibacillus protaetiae]
MILTFQCDCGNRTAFFATGDKDVQGREFIEPEDDERVTYAIGETGVMLQCGFCKQKYRLEKAASLGD